MPVGCFAMGQNGIGGQQCFEKPFWIGRTEVTNAQYSICVSAGVCTNPSDTDKYFDPSYANHPIDYVTWEQARVFADWWGGKLPNEAEWEYAARGPDGLIYPWGNDFNSNFVLSRSVEVGTNLGNVSWVGAFDMSGSVWEWTNTMVTRGGGWIQNEADNLNTTAREQHSQNFSCSCTAFRVARAFEENPNSDLVSAPTSTITNQQVTVSVNNDANLRAGPSTSYAIIGSALAGETLVVIGQFSSWYLIEKAERKMWISGRVVSLNNSDFIPVVTPSTVN